MDTARDMPPDRVAVIVRAFNEERHIGALLQRIREQRGAQSEVVVVDSGSTDLTPQIAREHGASVVRIDSRDFTFGYSLNAGVRATTAPYLAIISAHALPIDEHWLEALARPLRAERVAMVYGCQRGVPASKFSERRDFERLFGAERRSIRPPNFFANNANSAIRRDLWIERPFDEHLPGLEDIDWAKYWIGRGYEVLYEPDAGIYHIHEESWRQVRRRYFREGEAARHIGIKTAGAIFTESRQEISWALQDLFEAARLGELRRRAGEIVRFRYHKLIGTAQGLWQGATSPTPQEKTARLFDRYQQAVVVRGPQQVRVEEVPIPDVKPADVLIKVAYATICGTDVELVDGSLGYYHTGMASYPIIPGHEFSGRIMAVGANAGDWVIGDKVIVECIQSCGMCEACGRRNFIGCAARSEVGVMHRNGGFAEYVVTPGRFVHRLPAHVDLRSAALCEPTAVVLKGLRRLGPALARGGKARCAIVGGGPIGYITAAILGQRGHQVTVFDRDPRRRALYPVAEQDLARLANAEVIVEATGDPDALDAVLRNSSAGASILLLGLPYSRRDFSFESVVAYDKLILGSVGSAAEDFDEAARLIGTIPTEPLLQHLVPLASFADALTAAREQRFLKVGLAVDPLLDQDGLDWLGSGMPQKSASARRVGATP
jgi:2-desacetyl-2-hydroxyethyl bacteriochlorophyllide A dehydrogenase